MRLSTRDWHVPALVVAGLILARMVSGRLPFFALYFTAGTLLAAWLWTRYALRRTECLVQVEKDRMEVGESLGVRIRVDNDTFMPLPWVEIDDGTSQSLVSTDMPRQATSVPLLGSRIINFRLMARRRGHYTVGPIRITLGDAFGIFRGVREFRSRSAVTIYPRVHQIEGLPIPLSQPFGPVRTREKAFEDSSNQAEIREYRPGDNPRHIHWKTSARVGELMLKQYELNATTPIFLFPDLSARAHAGTRDGAASTEEMVVEIAASLAALGIRRKMDVGMVCSGEDRYAVSPGRGYRTQHEILEILARVEATGFLAPEQVLEMETAHLGAKSTLVIITARLSPVLANLLIRLRANHQVMLVLLRRETFPGSEAEPDSPELVSSLTSLLVLRRVAVYMVGAEDDIRRLAELKLSTMQEGVRSWSNGGRPSAIKA